MPLTPRQRAMRLIRIRKLVAKMFPPLPPPVLVSAEATDDAEVEDDGGSEPASQDMTAAYDTATFNRLPPAAIDAHLPW